MKLTKGKISRMLKTNHQTLKKRATAVRTDARQNHFTRNVARKRSHLSNKTLCNVKHLNKDH